MRHPYPLTLISVSVALILVFCYTFSTTSRLIPNGIARTKTAMAHLEAFLYCLGPWRKCIHGSNGDQTSQQDANHDAIKTESFFKAHEIDPAFSNVVNSVFPIDLVVTYNATNTSTTTTTVIARYASFSPILNDEVRGQYVFVAGSACSEITAVSRDRYVNKVLVVQRGKCTFEQKLSNIEGADLRPRAVIVANNVPRSGLITMYSKAFSGDSGPHFPVIFMAYEDAEQLRQLQDTGVVVSIRTASFDGFIGLVLLMAVSPPLMILVCYLIIRGMQLWGRRRRNQVNQRYVRLLPVHIYNKTHLVPLARFHEYLAHTNQTSVPLAPLALSSVDDVSAANDNSTNIPDTDLAALPEMDLLFTSTDYYPTQKCAICLGRFTPLKSRVLVLGCKHIFHENCLLNWLINFRKTCPLCNALLKLPENLPFLTDTPTAQYGTFDADLESSEHVLERQVSNTAVRSLQVNLEISDMASITASVAPVPSLRGYSEPRPAALIGNAASIASHDGNSLIPCVSNTGTSYFTTKSQQSTHASQMSIPSSYHTSVSVLSDNDDTETQLVASSRSTLRFQ